MAEGMSEWIDIEVKISALSLQKTQGKDGAPGASEPARSITPIPQGGDNIRR
jgi:hypothetical protein